MKSILYRGARLMLGAFVCSLLAASATFGGTAYSKIVVFGDSLNDRGNMVQFTNGAFPNAPNYAYGRQSNGPVWVEYLASRLGLEKKIENYAVVGALLTATANFPTGNVAQYDFPGMLQGTDVASQIADYLADAGGQADPAALYVLEGGGNDFNWADATLIVPKLIGMFLQLQAAGAKHIIVATLPDIGKTPRVIVAEEYHLIPAGTAEYLTGVTSMMNTAMAASVQAFAAPDVWVTVADLHGFMNKVAQNPKRYGFEVTRYDFLRFATGKAKAKNWLFWDDLHPTTMGHELLAEDVISSMLATYSANGKGAGQLREILKRLGKE